MSFNIQRGTLGSLAMLTAMRNALGDISAAQLAATSRHHHSPMVRTTLEVGWALTVLPPNSFMIAASYSGSGVFLAGFSAFDLYDLVPIPWG